MPRRGQFEGAAAAHQYPRRRQWQSSHELSVYAELGAGHVGLWAQSRKVLLDVMERTFKTHPL